MELVYAAAHLEEVERIVHELLGGGAGLEWPVVKRAAFEASQACGDGSPWILVFEMQLHQRREAEAHAVAVRLGKSGAQHSVKQEAGFKVGTGRRVLDPADAVAQIEPLVAFCDRAEQALETAAEVGSLADVRFHLRVLPAKQEHGQSGGDGGEDFGVAFGGEFQAVGQHEAILVRIRPKSTTEPGDPRELSCHGFTRIHTG